ncbi:MAG: SDR family NAD(P)-dependent oxidoreductase [Deltaproteobacteria bacterium]|nr:SDR family NAD(P)-dependent oxidoreductase [Deltaproteobacteria bacterium]
MHRQAVVTGASMGIGRAFAVTLAARGYRVLAVARSEPALARLLLELPGDGHGLLVADLATPEGVAAVVARMKDDRVHLLVNNAGAGLVGGFHEPRIDAHLRLIDLNVRALTCLCHAFLQQTQPGDALINVSSVLAFAPQPTQPVYAATKAFVGSLTESLWQEGQSRGVHVLSVAPGPTATEFGKHAGRPPGWGRAQWTLSTPEQVVHAALGALDRKRGPHVVPGLFNKVFVGLTHFVTRRWLVRLMGRAG